MNMWFDLKEATIMLNKQIMIAIKLQQLSP